MDSGDDLSEKLVASTTGPLIEGLVVQDSNGVNTNMAGTALPVYSNGLPADSEHNTICCCAIECSGHAQCCWFVLYAAGHSSGRSLACSLACSTWQGPTVSEKVKIDEDVEVISVRSASAKRARPRDQATVNVTKRARSSASTSHRSLSPRRDYPRGTSTVISGQSYTC